MKVRAILIDPFQKKITEIPAIQIDTFKDLYSVLNVDVIEQLDLELIGYKGYMLCDEEGLLKQNQKYFTFKNTPDVQNFAGKAVLVGGIKRENYTDCKYTVDQVTEMIKFI